MVLGFREMNDAAQATGLHGCAREFFRPHLRCRRRDWLISFSLSASRGETGLGISIRQLGHVFAGEVTGIDCREPLSSDEVAAIHAGMDQYAVLVFRDQQLTDEEQPRFTLHLGEIEKTRGGTPGHIHFRTDQEVRKLGTSIIDFSNVDPVGKPLSTDSRDTRSAPPPLTRSRHSHPNCASIGLSARLERKS